MEITCACGAVAVELTGEPAAQFYCHCRDCQIVHGAAYVPTAMFPDGAVEVTRGEPITWKLRVTARTTCPTCGTRIFAKNPDFPFYGVNAYLLPEGSFEPQCHLQCRTAVLPVKDALPHFADVPAEFGGTGALVEW